MKLIIILSLLLPCFTYASYFVSIKSNKANLRIGPSVDYPIEWIYIQKHTPVQVLEKYEQWRKIKDIDGTTGWMHQSLLSNKRYFIVTKPTSVRSSPNNTSKIKAYADPKITGKLIKCDSEWCKVQIDSITGWVSKGYTWGTEKDH